MQHQAYFIFCLNTDSKRLFENGTAFDHECGKYLKNILCSSCDPFAAHLFGTETSDMKEVAVLCPSYCESVYEACKNVPLQNLAPLVGSGYTGNKTLLKEVYSSDDKFCSLSATNESLYCYAGMAVADTFVVAQNSNLSYTNITGVDNFLCVEKVIGMQSPSIDGALQITPIPDKENQFVVVYQTGVVLKFEWTKNENCTRTLNFDGILLDLRNRTTADGEMGLLGFAFDPDFSANGSSQCNLDHLGVVSAFTVSDNGQADLDSETMVISFQQPYSNHNGGHIRFGPQDGNMYIFMGDGGGQNDPHQQSQDLSRLFGKILRIDVVESPYTIPSDNPFIGVQGAREEIWASGLRNPWRCDFDGSRPTYLLCGDVGQNAVEEINLIQKGGNYGWSKFEGTREHQGDAILVGSSPIEPVLEYTHTLNTFPMHSITGGVFVPSATAEKISPGNELDYIFADLYGTIFAAQETPYGNT
eukprot:CFRG8111T1